MKKGLSRSSLTAQWSGAMMKITFDRSNCIRKGRNVAGGTSEVFIVFSPSYRTFRNIIPYKKRTN